MEPTASRRPGSRSPLYLLRLGLKPFFFTKSMVRVGSGDPETSHSYAAIGPDCWGSPHDASLLPLLSFTLHVHITLLLSLPCVFLSEQVSLVWCFGAFCSLLPVLATPLPVEVDVPLFLSLVLPEVSSC